MGSLIAMHCNMHMLQISTQNRRQIDLVMREPDLAHVNPRGVLSFFLHTQATIHPQKYQEF